MLAEGASIRSNSAIKGDTGQAPCPSRTQAYIWRRAKELAMDPVPLHPKYKVSQSWVWPSTDYVAEDGCELLPVCLSYFHPGVKVYTTIPAKHTFQRLS